jgi:hypothetical protein
MFGDILQGRYEGWTGLVPQPTLEELILSVAPAVIHATQEKTRIATRYRVSQIQRATTPASIEAWSLVGSQEVSIIELEDPPSPNIDLTVEALGVPELKLGNKRFSPGYVVSEFIYPRRGIVLSIGEPLASNPSQGRKLLHARLFPPMSLQRYLTHVGEPQPGLPNPIA